MKKILALSVIALILFGLIGCTGLNTNTATNTATDIAFTVALQNNPEARPVVVAALQGLKTYLTQNVTYADLIQEISRKFGVKYAYIGIILQDYLKADAPIFESFLTMFGSYKIDIMTKLDRLILLASM